MNRLQAACIAPVPHRDSGHAQDTETRSAVVGNENDRHKNASWCTAKASSLHFFRPQDKRKRERAVHDAFIAYEHAAAVGTERDKYLTTRQTRRTRARHSIQLLQTRITMSIHCRSADHIKRRFAVPFESARTRTISWYCCS